MKGIATLAELFTVLAILFLVQTVLNFAASLESSKVDVERRIVITISQVPSDNEFVDHIRYFRIGEELVLFEPGGCGTARGFTQISPISHGSILRDGRCLPAEILPISALDQNTPDFEREFSERVAKRYGISVSFSSGIVDGGEAPGAALQILPRQFTLAYTVKDLPPKPRYLDLSIGYCLCTLALSPSSLEALPIWNLDADLPFPHPLVVRVTSLEAAVTTVRDIAFNHLEMERSGGKDVVRTRAGRGSFGTFFRKPGCDASLPPETAPHLARLESVREYAISLRNL
ncbi:MAG: hypothetical protein AB7I50_17415 [Vicinamibacterales bacterium]